jgi:hypothetical protein
LGLPIAWLAPLAIVGARRQIIPAWCSRPPPGVLARVSYAPPISGAELRSACVGATLGRPVNAAEVVFLLVFFIFSGFLVLLFSSGFLFCFLFYSFSFLQF